MIMGRMRAEGRGRRAPPVYCMVDLYDNGAHARRGPAAVEFREAARRTAVRIRACVGGWLAAAWRRRGWDSSPWPLLPRQQE